MKLAQPKNSLQILEKLPIAIATIDSNFQVHTFSKLWLNEFPAFALSKHISFNQIPNIPETVKQIVEKIVSGKTKLIWKKEIKNEQNIWHKWKISPFNDGIETMAVIIVENITQKKSAQKPSVIVTKKSLLTGSWEYNVSDNQLFWSKNTKTIHGVPIDFNATLETSFSFIKLGEHQQKLKKIIDKALISGKSWDAKFQITTANGKEKWVRITGESEFKNNACILLYGTYQDIRSPKTRNLKYKKLTNRLKIATKTAKIGIWEYKYKSSKLFWNDQMFELYNINKKHFQQDTSFWNQNIHPDDHAPCSKKVAVALAKKVDFELEYRIILPNEKIRFIKSITYVKLDKKRNIKKLVGANWDITTLKTTELQLSNSEESLQQAFENSSVGMALICPEGNWINVNPILCKSIGFSKSELLQMKIDQLTHPDDL